MWETPRALFIPAQGNALGSSAQNPMSAERGGRPLPVDGRTGHASGRDAALLDGLGFFQTSKCQFPLLTLLDAPDFTRLATGNPKSGPALPPGSGGSRGVLPFGRRQTARARCDESHRSLCRCDVAGPCGLAMMVVFHPSILPHHQPPP